MAGLWSKARLNNQTYTTNFASHYVAPEQEKGRKRPFSFINYEVLSRCLRNSI
jgi:hypothetical protein